MLDRRLLIKAISTAGILSPVFVRSLISQAEDGGDLGMDNIKQAEWISGIELTDQQRQSVLEKVEKNDPLIRRLRETKLSHDVGPALQFQTLSRKKKLSSINRLASPVESNVPILPDTDEAIAFLPVNQLSWLIRTQKITSERLTKIYLARLRKYAPMLRSVVTLTEEIAMQQAKRADDEICAGRYRGHLHGVPWGAKDLITVAGYPTTWGIPHYKNRILEPTATVAKRLEEAGAVLVAKLSLGALAMGDKWFGGMTRNPWNPRTGSSGSSAGSAASTVAGLVGFSLGSETLGSILSPSIRCGATGFRPTFGRVSRAGCMPLSWSMDKIGPICRSVEDCALVFDAIHGNDGKDMTTATYPFHWPSEAVIKGTRVGYRKRRKPVEERDELKLFKELGCELIEMELPQEIPLRAMTSIIDVEGASVFDQLLRDGHTDGWNEWPAIFRAANYITAVDYIRFQRARTMLMHQFEESFSHVDVMVNMNDLLHTNFTGHPSVVMPVGYRELKNDAMSPIPTVITGHLNDDEKLLAIAHAFQSRQNAHLNRPQLDYWLEKFSADELDAKQPEKKEL